MHSGGRELPRDDRVLGRDRTPLSAIVQSVTMTVLVHAFLLVDRSNLAHRVSAPSSTRNGSVKKLILDEIQGFRCLDEIMTIKFRNFSLIACDRDTERIEPPGEPYGVARKYSKGSNRRAQSRRHGDAAADDA